MALANYSDLKAKIASNMDRSDLTSDIPDFIALAEADINVALNVFGMESRAYATMTAGSDYLTLPSDHRSTRRLQIVSGGIDYMLEQVDPSYIAGKDDGGTGMPKVYSILADQIQFWPTPDSDYRVEQTYEQSLPALSDSNTTNWLLTDYPNIYLYGSLYHACVFIFDDKRAGQFAALFTTLLEQLESRDRDKKYGGHPLRTRAV